MTRSADRLVADRDARTSASGVTPEYNRALSRAHQISRTAGTPTEHRAAATAFRKAAALATDDRSRTLHTKLAENHESMALAEEQSHGDLRQLNTDAAKLHSTLARTVQDPTARRYHLDEAAKHRRMAAQADTVRNASR